MVRSEIMYSPLVISCEHKKIIFPINDLVLIMVFLQILLHYFLTLTHCKHFKYSFTSAFIRFGITSKVLKIFLPACGWNMFRNFESCVLITTNHKLLLFSFTVLQNLEYWILKLSNQFCNLERKKCIIYAVLLYIYIYA